jgi:hypothetical protein
MTNSIVVFGGEGGISQPGNFLLFWGRIFGQIWISSTILTKFAVLGAKLVKFWASQFSSKTPEVHKLS